MASDEVNQIKDLLSNIHLSMPSKSLIEQIELPTLEETIKFSNIPLNRDILTFKFKGEEYTLRLIQKGDSIFFYHKPSQITANTPGGIIRKVVAKYQKESTQGRGWQSIFVFRNSLKYWRSSCLLDKVCRKLLQISKDIIKIKVIDDRERPGVRCFALVVDDPEQFKLEHPELVDDPAITIEKDSKIIVSGYLEKRGKLNTAWKRRWCLAKEDQVFYYKSKDQRRDKPTGVISLSSAVIRACYDDIDRENVFDIVTKERVYKLAAPSRSELNEWIKALEPSTNFQVENSIIIEAENNIKQATKARALDAEAKYIEEFNRLQLKRFEAGQPTQNTSSEQKVEEKQSNVEIKIDADGKDKEEESDDDLVIVGDDDSDSGDGEELERERQEIQQQQQKQEEQKKAMESNNLEPNPRTRGNSFLTRPTPSQASKQSSSSSSSGNSLQPETGLARHRTPSVSK